MGPLAYHFIQCSVVFSGTYMCNVIGRLYGPTVVIKKTKPTRRRHRPRSGHPNNFQCDATLAFVRTVRKTFHHKPEIYEEFKMIMTQLQKPEVDYISLIKRVIILFNGYPQLIYTFSAFLPSCYDIELQDDAVVIKVYDKIDGELQEEEASGRPPIDRAAVYVQGVKKALVAVRPKLYQRFMTLLEDFHTKRLGVAEVIREIVKLFKGHPNLVLGFNDCLPDGWQIHMYDTKHFTVEQRDSEGVPKTITLPAI